MRGLLVAGLAGAALVYLSGGSPAMVWNLYQQLYPSDPGQRQALDQCFLENHGFDRLDSAARADCYRHSPGLEAADASGQAASEANFVDLWRAAGAGTMPQNDVRAAEQTGRLYRSVASASTR